MEESPLEVVGTKSKSKQVEKPVRQDFYGLNIQQLTKWQSDRNAKFDAKERSMQAKAVARVVGFLNAINVAVQIQSWYRMIRVRRKYYVVLAERKDIKYMFFRAWRIHHFSEKMHRYSTVGQYFMAWKDELTDSKRLKKLIYEFFKICIKRSRLTPQACMCYFNPGEWSNNVSVEDMLKIRRMMMEKLFSGWRTETRELRIMRSKATQVLSRMVRRTKGPLWVKEASLVCFHMWYRYVKVKRAYRLEEPDPRFTNPYLPQWTKLFKEITLARVKRKRSMETGHKLTQMRAFRTWKYLKSIDRSKPVTALAVAIIHYGKVLAKKCLIAWYDVVRERGKIVRFRNEIFYRWKKWAPSNRKLWAFNDKALAWLRLKQMRRAYNVMVDLCLDVISRRTERMKELRRNFYDRKVVICAYALMNKNEHVIFVDCWRRLYRYWQCRRNWKLFNLQRKYQWHLAKARSIFTAWRTYTQARLDLKKSTIPQMRELFGSVSVHTPSSRFPSMLAGQGGSPSMMSTMQSTSSRLNSIATIGEDSNDDQSVESLGEHSIESAGTTGTGAGGVSAVAAAFAASTTASASHHGHHASPVRGSLSAGGQMRSSRALINTHRRKRHTVPDPEYEKLVESYLPVGFELMEAAMAGNISKHVIDSQFQLFCLAILQSRASAKASAENEKRETEKPRRASFTGATPAAAATTTAPAAVPTAATAGGDIRSVASSAAPTPGTTAAPTPRTGEPPAASAPPEAADKLLKQLNGLPGQPGAPAGQAVKASAAGGGEESESSSTTAQVYNVALQEKLQRAIDEMAMDNILSAVAEGAVIESQHVKQVAQHVGDQFIPAFTLLLSGGVSFMAERIVKKDIVGVLNACQNPVNALLMGSQIERWNRRDLTKREWAQLTDSPECHTLDAFGGVTSTINLWHMVVLKLIDVRNKTIALTCNLLTDDRTINQEVGETLKRNKIERLNHIRKNMVQMFGMNDEHHQIVPVPALVVPHAVLKASKSFMAKKAPQVDASTAAATAAAVGAEERDIYIVLREFTLMTGKLTNEGKAMRGPLMERDRNLIINGFVKQSKRDFQALRRQCMTPAQLAAEDERLAKEAAAKKKKDEKGKKKGKKKRRKGSAKKKKAKKAKKKGKSSSGADTDDSDYESDGDLSTIGSTSGDEWSVGGGGSVSVKFNDYYMDGEFLYSDEQLGITEEGDLKREKEFQKRMAPFKHVIYQEIWQPQRVHMNETTKENLVERNTYEMKAVIHRLLAVLQKDEHIGSFDFPLIRSKFGGLGQYLLDRGTGDEKVRKSRTWHVLPKEWWSFKQVKSRLAKELAIVEGAMVQHRTKIAQQNDINDGLDEEINYYEKYLKTVRKEVLKISQKRNEKSAADHAEKQIKVNQLRRAERQLAATNKQVATLADKLRLSEIYLASGNVKGVLGLLKPPEPEEDEETKKKKEKEKKKKAAAKAKAAGGKTGATAAAVADDEEGDSDGSEDSYSIYALIEQAKEELVKLKESVVAIEAKRLKIDLDIRDYERQCYRTTKLLKNVAEDRFNTMVEVQAMVIRTTKALENSDASKNAFSKARKLSMKYFMQLRAFSDVNMQSRGLQLAKDVENKRLTELLRKPGTAGSLDSGGGGHSRSGTRGTMRSSFSGSQETHHHARPDHVTRHSVDVSNSVSGYEHLESLVLPDITVTGEELEQYDQAHRHSPTESMYSYDDDSNSRADEESHSRATSRGAEPIDPLEYRPLTVDEEIMLLHQNSIGNRKKREEELRRIAQQQAEEAAANELRSKVFDDYWSSYPKKEIYFTAAQQAAEVALKKKKEKEEAEKEAAAVAKATAKPLTKTQKMWQSVGAAYWRNKEDQIRNIFEEVLAKEMAEAEDDFGDENMELVIQKQKEAQLEINKRKSDPFEECVVVDVRKEWDKQPAEPLSGLMHRISTEFKDMSDAVWQSTIVPPPPPGALAALAVYVERPPISSSIKDLMEHKRQLMKDVAMPEMLQMAENVDIGDYGSRRPSDAHAGSRRPSLKDAAHGIIAKDIRRTSLSGVVEAVVNQQQSPPKPSKKKNHNKVDIEDEEELDVKVVDPFAVIGKLEYMRFKVGMQAKSELTHKDDDMSFSVESRTGGSVGSQNSRRRSLTSDMEKRFSPSKDMSDDLSDVSEGEASHTSSHQHQKQVDQYLNMIDEPAKEANALSDSPSTVGSKGSITGKEKAHRHLSKKETDFLLTEAALAGGMDIITNLSPIPSKSTTAAAADDLMADLVSPLATPSVVEPPAGGVLSPSRLTGSSPDQPGTRVRATSTNSAEGGPVSILSDKAAKPSAEIKAPKLVRFGEEQQQQLEGLSQQPRPADASVVMGTAEGAAAPPSGVVPAELTLAAPVDIVTPPVIVQETAAVEPTVSAPSVDAPAPSVIEPLMTPLDALIQTQKQLSRTVLQDDETSEISMDENLRMAAANATASTSLVMPVPLDLHSHDGSNASPPAPMLLGRTTSRVQFSDSATDVLTPIHVSITKAGSSSSSHNGGPPPPSPKIAPFSPSGKRPSAAPSPMEGEATPEHLGKVLVAANAARSTIKVKRNAPLHNVHEKYLPHSYSHEVGGPQSQDRPDRENEESDGEAFLEMPVVDSPQQTGNKAVNLGYRKKKLIVSDRASPSPTRHLTILDPSEEADLIAVPVGGQWELQSPTMVETPHVNKELHYSLNVPEGLKIAGVPLVKQDTEPKLSLDGLADHDLPDTGARLIGMLGLSPTHGDTGYDDLEEEVHLVNDPKNIPAELNYDSLLNLVDEFKTELKLLEDKEMAVAEDKVHKSISFFPSNFRADVMKNAPLIPRRRRGSTDSNPEAPHAPANAASAATAAGAAAPGSAGKQTPTKRNRNLTKATPPSTAVTVSSSASAAATASGVPPPPHHGHSPERRESKAMLSAMRPASPREDNEKAKKPTAEELERALHKYLVDTYHLNPKDVQSGHMEEEGVEKAVWGIKQYLSEQENMKREAHSSGRVRPLESRDMAARYRNAIKMADTLTGQGGMFFKPQSPSSPSSRYRQQQLQQQLAEQSRLSEGSSMNLKRAGSANFWVEVIKLLHPENEQYDDVASELTELRRVPTSGGRKNLLSNDGAPDLSLDVKKLNPPSSMMMLPEGQQSTGRRSALESFRASNNQPAQSTPAEVPPYIRMQHDASTGAAAAAAAAAASGPLSKDHHDPSKGGLAYSQSDSLLLQSKPHRVPRLPYNDRFKPEVLDFISSQPVLAGKRMEKSATAEYLPNAEEYYRTGSGSGIREKQNAELQQSISTYLSTHPEAHSAYKMDTGVGLKELQESFGFAPNHELKGVSLPSSPANSRPVSPQATNRKTMRSNSQNGEGGALNVIDLSKLNAASFDGSLGSAQIISEIAGEHYHMSGNNSVVNTERQQHDLSPSGLQGSHNSSFHSPLLDAGHFQLKPPSPDSISIYSKHTLRSAEGRMHNVPSGTAAATAGAVLDSKYILGENSLLVGSHVLHQGGYSPTTGSPPRSPHAKFSCSTSSPPMSAGRRHARRDRTIATPPRNDTSRELDGLMMVTALTRANSSRSAKRPINKVSTSFEAADDIDDNSSIQSSNNASINPKYVGSLEGRSLTLDDYMRLKQQEGKYLQTTDGDDDVSVGKGGVVAHFKRRMRTPSPTKPQPGLAFLHSAAVEEDPTSGGINVQLELSSVEAMKKAFMDQEALEERLRQERLAKEKGLSAAPSLKIASKIPSTSNLLDEVPPVQLTIEPSNELHIIGTTKSPIKRGDSNLIIDDESTVNNDDYQATARDQPDPHVVPMAADDEEDMERELRAMLNQGNSVAYENARLYAAMYNGVVQRQPLSSNVPFLAGNGTDSKHLSTRDRDRLIDRRSRPVKNGQLPPLQLQATPPSSAGASTGRVGEAETVYRGLSETLRQQKILKPLPPKKTINPLYVELAMHLPNKRVGATGASSGGGGLYAGSQSVQQMSVTAPQLSSSAGAVGSAGRTHRAGSITSLGSNSSSKYSKELQPMAMSVEFKSKKKAL